MRHHKAPLSRRTVRSSSYCARIGRPGERLCGVLQAKWDLKGSPGSSHQVALGSSSWRCCDAEIRAATYAYARATPMDGAREARCIFLPYVAKSGAGIS